ncbi:MAG: hypothetical protein MHM6MM_004511 [Cercozoa sp. M6MM]
MQHAQALLSQASARTGLSPRALSLLAAAGLSTISLAKLLSSKRSYPRGRFHRPTAVPKDTEYDADLVIVGAGVVGTALAHVLGEAGLKVILLERNTGDENTIIGELMQPAGVRVLEEIGMGACFDDINAQRTSGYEVHFGEQSMLLDYPHVNSGDWYPARDDGSDVRARAVGMHHHRLVRRMREICTSHPSVQLVQATVRSLVRADNGRITGVDYTTQSDGDSTVQRVTAPLTVVANGSASKFRSELVNGTASVRGRFVGVQLEVDVPEDARAHVVLMQPAPVLYYPIASSSENNGKGHMRVLVDIPAGMSLDKVLEGVEVPYDLGSSGNDKLKKYMLGVVAPAMPVTVREAFVAAVLDGSSIQACRNIMLCGTPRKNTDGALVLGDILNMRHPVTGAGMTVALLDVQNVGRRLRSLHQRGLWHQHGCLDKACDAFYNTRVPRVSTLNVLADALYGVFSVNPDLCSAFFGYVAKQGYYSHGPMRLLSGLSLNHTLIGTHFFSVAFDGVKRLLLPNSQDAASRFEGSDKQVC